MKYFSKEEIIAQGWANAAQLHRIEDKAINVRLCRDCPFFELYSWQPDKPDTQYGWCRRMSYYITFDDEVPYYVDVNSKSFCNEDDITEENY